MTAAAALQPAQAKAPPAAAAAPPVFAPAIDSGVRGSGPVGSLSQIPVSAPSAPPSMDVSATAPTVQRKCETCENEGMSQERDHETAETIVRPRLEVGAADDPFEREADAIAGQVMALRDSDVARSYAEPSAAPASVQRACSACSQASRDDEVRARRARAEVSMDEEEAPRMQGREAGAGPRGGESIAASHSDLTSGGSALPEATRTFFEDRMGRDLSDVRLHTGSAAHDYSTSIGAKAFTYENHIWLGKGETTGPSFTMAHELAHVLQQTSPGAVGAAHDVYAKRDRGAVRRVVCKPDQNVFFCPAHISSVTRSHNASVDKAIADNQGLRKEVRVPNANKNGFQYSSRRFGFADLYWSNNNKVVGTGFVEKSSASTTPPQPWYQVQYRSKVLHPHRMTSRHVQNADLSPLWGRNGRDFERGAADAPTSIKLGDMKFAGGSDYTSRVDSQLTSYFEGFDLAKELYNQASERSQNAAQGSNAISGSSSQALPSWNLSTAKTDDQSGDTNWREVRSYRNLVPKKWTFSRTRAAMGRNPIVVEKCNNVPSNTAYDGKLLYRNRPGGQGVWDYIFWPDQTSTRFGPSERRAIDSKKQWAGRLWQAVRGSPTRVSPRRLIQIGTHQKPSQDLKKIRRTPTRRRRGRAVQQDPFVRDYRTWTADQRRFTRDWERFPSSRDGKRSLGALFFDQAIRNSADAVNQSLAGSPTTQSNSRLDGALRDYNLIDKMSGKTGRFIGMMRKTFGGAFNRVLRAYEALRLRFTNYRPTQTFGGRRLVRAAIKVAGKVVGAILTFMLPRIGELLIECMQRGIQSRFDSLLDEANLEEQVEEGFGPIQQRFDQIESDVQARINGLREALDGYVGGYIEDALKALSKAGRFVSMAVSAFNVARLAICAAGGLTSAGISCIIAGVDWLLSLVDASPSELIAESILETCTAQKTIASFVLGFGAVRNLPSQIAEGIRSRVRGQLPEGVSGLVCDSISEESSLPSVDEVTCGNGGSVNGGTTHNWQLPPGVSAEDLGRLNRRPTDAEVAQNGDIRTQGAGAASPPEGEDPPSDPERRTTPQPEVGRPSGTPDQRRQGQDSDESGDSSSSESTIPERAEERELQGETQTTQCAFGFFDGRRVEGRIEILVRAACNAPDGSHRFYGAQWVAVSSISRVPNSSPPRARIVPATTQVLEEEGTGNLIQLDAGDPHNGFVDGLLPNSLDQFTGGGSQ